MPVSRQLLALFLIRIYSQTKLLTLATARVVHNILNGGCRRFQFCLIKRFLQTAQFIVLSLQFIVAKKCVANLLRLLFGGFLVQKPDQVVSGKGFYHRQYCF
jgi:hypothetical protein